MSQSSSIPTHALIDPYCLITVAPYYSTCDCGECTIGRMIQGDKCTKPGKKWFPGLLLLNRAHTRSLLSQLHRGIVETGEAYSETEELETKFGRYYTQTLNRLDESVKIGRKFFGRYRQLTWETVYKKLADRFVESRNLRVDNIISLKAYLSDELKISWFNFLPVQKIAEWFLSSQSDLQQNWNEYIGLFKGYCTNRNMKDVVKTLFNSDSDNIFMIQVDDVYNNMKVCDIAHFRKTLADIFKIKQTSLHLVAVDYGSLCILFSFHYDYLLKFQNLSLFQLYMLSHCNVLTLRDTRNRFEYENIQNYKVHVNLNIFT